MFTILTPTYNRAHTLVRLFNSIQNQTFLNFNWLIIDDGSIENTIDVVQNFKLLANFEILYVYKENGGKHSALVYAKNNLKK